jgi:hypothetical protein
MPYVMLGKLTDSMSARQNWQAPYNTECGIFLEKLVPVCFATSVYNSDVSKKWPE